MALSIHTNYSSLMTQTSLNKSSNMLATNQQRLGTGFRVNSAADDAAGLQIATRLNAQSRGMEVAMRNAGDATSLLQTAEGAFNEMTDILSRMKDLATQSGNDTNSTADRTSMQREYDALGKELANVMSNTAFGGEKLFSIDGSTSKFKDAVNFQVGATKEEQLTVNVSSAVSGLIDGLTDVSSQFVTGTPTASGSEITGSGAADMIATISTQLDNVGALRGELGANINRLGHIINNQANMQDNTEMAKGRILDADMAKESVGMTKNNMLVQSGISMLKQTSQMPQLVLSLLG